MLYIQIKEIISYVREVDEVISSVFEKFAGKADNPSSVLVAEYLGRHYKRLSGYLANLSEEDYKVLMERNIAYAPQLPDFRRIEKLQLPDDATSEQLIDAAIEVDEQLAELFRTILDQPVGQEVRDFVESMIQYEEADEEKLKQLKAARYY